MNPSIVLPPATVHRVLAAALLLGLAACGGGSGTEPPAAQDSAALAASRPGELTAYVQQRLRTLDAQGRLGGGATLVGLPVTASPQPTAGSATPARSSTLVQEAGVDEADLIQTDGSHLYTLQPQDGAGPRVAVYRRNTAGRALALAEVALPGDGAVDIGVEGMVFSSNQQSLAVITRRWLPMPAPEACADCASIAVAWMRSTVDVQRVDVSTPAAARAGERISIDGTLVDSRRIGDSLVVVTSHRPTLPVEVMPAGSSAADRAAAIARVTTADLLPRMRRNGGASEALLADTDCYLQPANGSLDLSFTTITVFDLRSPTLARSSRCFVGGSEAMYMSPGHLYVATTRWSYPEGPVALVYPPLIQTDIHKFALTGATVAYRGTGQVDGHLGWNSEQKSYRLSEHNGDLRVLSFSGQTGWAGTRTDAIAPSPARLTVLRERSSDQTLQVVSTLPNTTRTAALGKPGEQVYAVRFVGDRGYVVTFMRTDPLYVLDLSNPADPRTVGEVEVAGFSEVLVPLDNGLLLGVGRDADRAGRITGLKVALFDIGNPATPTQRASLTLGAAGSASALDFSRHGLNFMTVGNTARVALPVNLSSTDSSGWQMGLQQLQVDTAAATLVNRGLLGARSAGGPLWLERSTQIGDQVYYLSQGSLQTFDW